MISLFFYLLSLKEKLYSYNTALKPGVIFRIDFDSIK